MAEPEEINLKELMENYGYRGPLGRIKTTIRIARSWLLQVLASASPSPGFAAVLQRSRGVKVGRHVYLGPGVLIDLLYPHMVTIRDYASIGMNTMIFAHSNPTCSKLIKERFYPRKVLPVVVKEGAWIAPGCIVLAGVTIGENAVLGAGSVATENIDPWTVCVGAPARPVKKLPSTEPST